MIEVNTQIMSGTKSIARITPADGEVIVSVGINATEGTSFSIKEAQNLIRALEIAVDAAR